jgi:hypothetical protein
LFYIDNPLHEDLTSSENKILPEKDNNFIWNWLNIKKIK